MNGSIFSDDQRAELLGLGVNVQQLAHLEAWAPFARVQLATSPAARDVRDNLESFLSDLQRAATAISGMIEGRNRGTKARRAAAAQMHFAEQWPALAGEGLSAVNLAAALGSLQMPIRTAQAILALPVEQVRHRVSGEPAACVDSALKRGWAESRGVVIGNENYPGEFLNVLANPDDPYLFRPTASQTSPFFRVATIYYAALSGNADASSERAIRAYVRSLRALYGKT